MSVDINSNISYVVFVDKMENIEKKIESDDSAIQSSDDHSSDEAMKSLESSASYSDVEGNLQSPTPEEDTK